MMRFCELAKIVWFLGHLPCTCWPGFNCWHCIWSPELGDPAREPTLSTAVCGCPATKTRKSDFAVYAAKSQNGQLVKQACRVRIVTAPLSCPTSSGILSHPWPPECRKEPFSSPSPILGPPPLLGSFLFLSSKPALLYSRVPERWPVKLGGSEQPLAWTLSS